ncbi:MAG: Flp pilus assembly complex ATPase component TadA [Alphaproteobacteria bacterium]|nr:Flp pilus assembly complex ATPase component TadA [Alphaproteobacteria bacterium]
MTDDHKLAAWLTEHDLLDQDTLDAVLRFQREERPRAPLSTVLLERGAVGEASLAEAVAGVNGVPFTDPAGEDIDPALIWKVPRELAERFRLIPLNRQHQPDGEVDPDAPVRVAMAEPRDMIAKKELEFTLGARIQPVAAAPGRIDLAIQLHYDLEPQARKLLDAVPENLRVAPAQRAVRSLDAPRHGLRGADRREEGSAFIRLLDYIFLEAIERRASDVHLAPQPDGLRVRFRIDGMLHEVLELPAWATQPLLSRLKVIAGMSVYEHRRPQDGSLTATHAGRHVDMRVSTMPGQYGENAVVRLLDPRMLSMDLGRLGWDRRALAEWYRLVSQRQGLVLVVGPTGSGKSTTLYATIHRLRREQIHIATLEDPVEYRIAGISQVQVNTAVGMTFAAGIRTLLRQDPDVMVVGEIRDAGSAEAAVEAANTGHLVLSTVHTGYAVDAVTRLADLGVPPYLLGSALLGVVAQRLVRRVCPDCSVRADPVQEDWQRLDLEPRELGDAVRRAGDGCPSCAWLGYKGRVGIFEVLRVGGDLRRAIHDGISDDRLWNLARKGGLHTLMEDALDKVAAGVTTLEEIARVIPQERWKNRDAASERPLRLVRPDEQTAARGALQERQGAGRHGGEEAAEGETYDFAPVWPGAEGGGEGEGEGEGEAVTAEQHPTAAVDEDEPPRDAQGFVAEPRLPVVLVVDDHEEILQLVHITLEGRHEVHLARDGQEALDQVARHKPDAIVLDVMMPRLSGYEVAERLKGDPATADIPILILSARGDAQHIKEGFQAGADDYLPKPFDPEELELRVRALLRRAGKL